MHKLGVFLLIFLGYLMALFPLVKTRSHLRLCPILRTARAELDAGSKVFGNGMELCTLTKKGQETLSGEPPSCKCKLFGEM